MADLTGALVGSIRIEERLGGGGMGEVWRGFDTRLERTVAVKTVRADRRVDAEFKQRFRREAKLLGKLGHPGICQVYDLVETPDADFLVMEYLEGCTLDKHVRSGFPRERLYAIFAQLASALAAAHGQRVVHRDLKPENIHVGAGDRVRILDFGIARSVREGASAIAPAGPPRPAVDSGASTAPAQDQTTLMLPGQGPEGVEPPNTELISAAVATSAEVYTGIGQVVGTCGYMSPEQASGLEVGTASDIYALGLCLDRMLELCAPASSKDQREAAALVAGMLAADPQRRPAASEVEAELQRLIELPRARERAQLRRRLIRAASLGSLLLALAMVWLALDARRARAEAEQRRAQAENLVDYLLGELRGQLLEVGRVDLLDSVNQRAQQYLDASGTGDAQASQLRARLLGSRIAVAMRRGEYAAAQTLARAALAEAEAQVGRQADPRIELQELADAHYWLGYLAIEQMQPAERALVHFDQLVRLRERLRALDPGLRQPQLDLAVALTSRVAAYGAKGAQALADARQAVAIYRSLGEQLDAQARSEYASALAWLSSVHENAGELPEAISVRAENVELLSQLLGADPDNAVYAQDLAVALNFQTLLAQQLGRDEEALALVSRGCALLAKARRRDPEDREHARNHAVCLAMRAGTLMLLGRLEEAAAQARASVAALEQLLSEAGAQSDWPGQLVASRVRLAEIESAAGRCAPATAVLDALTAGAGEAAPGKLQRVRIDLVRARCAQDRERARQARTDAAATLGEVAAGSASNDLAWAAVIAIESDEAALREQYLRWLRERGYRGTLVRQACARARLPECL